MDTFRVGMDQCFGTGRLVILCSTGPMIVSMAIFAT